MHRETLHVDIGNPAAEVALVSLRGRLSGPTDSRILLDATEGLRPGLNRVVLDCRELEYMDCAGVGALAQLACASRSANRRLVLAGMNGRVREILDAAGVLGHLEHVDSLTAALGSAK